jgi:chemotaxis protein CheC
VRTEYTEIELDALRELANIGSGTAATSLSGLLGRPIDVSVPTACALPLADAIDAAGPAEVCVTGVAIALEGELEGLALMLFPERDAATLCRLLGLDPADELAASALDEVVNILSAAYVGALIQMTGATVELGPPESVHDMLGAIMGTLLAGTAGTRDTALLLDSALSIEGESCSLPFLLLPAESGVDSLLTRLGLDARA